MAYQVTYNKESYDVSIDVARFDPDKPDQLVEASKYTLVQDYLSKITLMNDLAENYPYLEIEYIDKGHNLWNKYVDDGYTSLLFRMKLYREEGQEGVELQHSFIVSSISLISSTTNEAVYRIKCTSLLYNILRSHVEYSTGGKMKAATLVAKEILKKTQYPITIKKGDAESPRETCLPYISPSNFTVLQNVKYLIEKAVTPSSGLFYLIYDCPSREGKMLNINDVFRKFPDNVDNRNVFSVPMKYTESVSYMNIVDIKMDNHIGASIYNLLGSTVLNNFDYMHRKWSRDVFDYGRMMRIMPSVDVSKYPEFRHIHKKNPSPVTLGNKYASEETSVSYDEVFSKIDALYKYSNVISFNQWGYIGRDIGQMVALYSHDVVANAKYAGPWMITRIYHTFTRDTYENNITAVRTMAKNVDETFTLQGTEGIAEK
jgi:hypothetical protein